MKPENSRAPSALDEIDPGYAAQRARMSLTSAAANLTSMRAGANVVNARLHFAHQLSPLPTGDELLADVQSLIDALGRLEAQINELAKPETRNLKPEIGTPPSGLKSQVSGLPSASQVSGFSSRFSSQPSPP